MRPAVALALAGALAAASPAPPSVGGPEPRAEVAPAALDAAPAAQQDDGAGGGSAEARDEPPDPLPQRPEEGIRGVHVRSRLVLLGAREAPVDLTYTHVYPDRSRLNHEPATGDPRDSRRWLRAGARAWLMDARQPKSEELAGPTLARWLLELELRRALFLWPDGLGWSHAVDGMRAEVQLPMAANHDVPLGRLVARLDDQARPHRITALLPDGGEVAALVVEARDEAGAPSRLELFRDGQPIGRETVLSVGTDFFFHDSYFVPPDRRARGADAVQRVWRTLDLRSVTLRRIALAADATWADARARRDELAREAAAELADGPHRLSPAAAFEVDWAGNATAVLLRLEQSATTPPEGWTTLPERPGVALVLRGLEQLDTSRLAALRRGVPEDAVPAVPYVLLHDGQPYAAQVFLGYEPPR